MHQLRVYVHTQLLQYQQKFKSSQEEVSRLQDLLAKANQEKAVVGHQLQTLQEKHEQAMRKSDRYKEENSKLKKTHVQETATLEQLHQELQQNKTSTDGVEQKCTGLERRIREVESQADIERRSHKKKMEKLMSSHASEIVQLKKNMDRKYNSRLA